VIRFAQLTGDAKTLSATDIQVIALAYQLEKQYNGMHFLKSEPVSDAVSGVWVIA
jgi:RNA-binding protein NOB1